MSGKTRLRRPGFTLVELLVVIAIIGVLVGLAIPVIQMAQARARTMECANNMRNLSHAVLQYELAMRQYPGYANVLIQSNGKPYTDPVTGQKHAVSFVAMLWSYLDRPDIDRMWRTPPGAAAAGGQGAPMLDPRIEVRGLFCTADPPTITGTAPLSYVGNCGMQDVTGTPSSASSPGIPRDYPENGIFFDLYTDDPRVANVAQGGGQGGQPKARVPLVRMTNAVIARGDGASNTLMISENVDAGEYLDYTEAKTGMVWDGSGTIDTSTDPPTLKPRDNNMRINVGTGVSDLQAGAVQNSHTSSQSTTFARPSSWHPKGVNASFCDGRISFISEATDYYVYCLLMSPSGSRVRMPGTNKVLPSFDRSLVETWYTQ